MKTFSLLDCINAGLISEMQNLLKVISAQCYFLLKLTSIEKQCFNRRSLAKILDVLGALSV